MAREINSRLRIEGKLIAETPLHVGGYGESFETDLALAKNGRDEFYIPGTSLTGVLRSWFEKAFPGEADSVWGFQVGDQGHASFVLIEDLTLPEQVQSELRDGVGIDRHYGTAAEGAKFDRAILPRGTVLDFVMMIEMQNDTAKIKARFGYLLEALKNGEIRLGASKTRGLGKVKLQNIKIREDKFIGFDILEILKAKEETKEEQEKRFTDFDAFKIELQKVAKGETKSNYDKFKPNPSEQIAIAIDWKPKSPLMVKAGYEGIGVDTLPLVSINGKGKVSLCLPGSSVKGAFRAHAERILRTVFDFNAPTNSNKSDNFSNQLQMFDQNDKPTKATQLIGEIFGAKKEREEKDKPNQSKSTLGLGALSIDDCYTKEGFSMKADNWQKVETGKVTKTVPAGNNKTKEEEVSYSEQELWKAIKAVEEDSDLTSSTKNFHIAHHTAIDRFTGAAAETALYSVLKPTAEIRWENLCLTLDFNRLYPKDADESAKQKQRRIALMLLLLVLRDFAENRLPLGFATTRGMGEVKDVSFEIKGAYNISYRDGQFNFKDDEKTEDESQKLKNKIQKEWDKWRTESQTSNS
ncbi:MAG TPA: RAMP superfamily CRISPR-associated protein [Pyrinomonadaceae bacterium]|nr:RAMP superfamily CRISPR-associated protein [Pyrinomonadaceae bacterium]